MDLGNLKIHLLIVMPEASHVNYCEYTQTRFKLVNARLRNPQGSGLR